LVPDKDFRLSPYFDKLIEEFAALGFDVEISEKLKTADTDIASAFLKRARVGMTSVSATRKP